MGPQANFHRMPSTVRNTTNVQKTMPAFGCSNDGVGVSIASGRNVLSRVMPQEACTHGSDWSARKTRHRKIGRASCRERVEMAVGEVLVKKKKSKDGSEVCR